MDEKLQNWLNDETEIDDERLIEEGMELLFPDAPQNLSDEKTLQLLLI